MILKKAISVLLILATLMGCLTGLISCTGRKDSETEGGKKLTYKSEPVVDFNQASVITASGLTVTTDNVKTATNAGVWNTSTTKISFTPSTTDLTAYKELSVWINNTSSKKIVGIFRLISDDASTGDEDSYGAEMAIQPGWHLYTIPFSELTTYEPIRPAAVKIVGEPLGLEAVSEIRIEAPGAGSIELIVDSIYGKTQKFGTLKGQNYPELSSAVCFYEDSYAYLYGGLRNVLNEANVNCAVKADDDTTYVPVEILAAHKGATNIVASAEKVSFKYNGTDYSFTPDSDIEYVGVANGKREGKALSSKPMVMENYIMLPMEKCAEIFGYELFYDKMGLAIFSDTKNIYNSDTQYDYIYEIIKVIAFENYSGAELVDNITELYGENGHTRLLMNQADFDRLKELVETDPTYRNWFTEFEAGYAKGTTKYNNTMFKYELRDGYRLLGMSRDVMGTLIPYAFLYKMTDNPDYANKCYKIMEQVSRFRDNDVTGALSWHPEHFLDTGEIMFGYGVAYDWCYDALTEEQRSKLEKAVWELGYGAALGWGELYEWWSDRSNLEALNAEREADGKQPYDGYSINRAPYQVTGDMYDGINDTLSSRAFNFNRSNWSNNWNGVCNGGMVTMALAFATVNEEFREWSEYLLDCCMYSIPYGLKDGYAPDGGYPESPGYWSYGTNYSINFIQGLMSSCGTNLGYINAPGFRESFYYINYIGSTANGVWSYHDTGEGMPDMGRFTWFTSQTGDKDISGLWYNGVLNGTTGVDVWNLMFYDPELVNTAIQLPLDTAYYGIDTMTFRSGWEKDAMFAGLHGGYNNASHGNLDIGNFILEMGGTRFFIDLGADEYNLKNPAYASGVLFFSNPYRWWFYRERAEGQNTLVINPVKVDTSNKGKNDSGQGKNFDQILSATSSIQKYSSGENSAYGVIDMGVAYHDATSGIRGMYITENRNTVVIQDEIRLRDLNNKVYWMGHVKKGSEIEITEDKTTALITYEGLTLVASIVVPEGYEDIFEFRRMSANYLQETGLVTCTGEYDRSGLSKLVVYSENCPKDLKLAVVFRLLNDGPHSYTWTPIDEWVAE